MNCNRSVASVGPTPLAGLKMSACSFLEPPHLTLPGLNHAKFGILRYLKQEVLEVDTDFSRFRGK
jgi:hypothetical protein